MRSRQSVSLTALRSRGLEASRHHMMGFRTVVIFLRYWCKRPAGESAIGFKATLDQPDNKRYEMPRSGVKLSRGTGA